MKKLTVNHGHYDESGVNKDINCILPIDRLLDLKKEGIIGDIATNHYSFMGFIPDVEPLLEKYIPLLIKKLKDDNIDIAVFSPAWPLCHRSVGLIQREVEKAGIRTAAIAHLLKAAKKGRPPRIMHVDFPLGRAYGHPNNKKMQKEILLDLLKFSIDGGDEEIRECSYKW